MAHQMAIIEARNRQTADLSRFVGTILTVVLAVTQIAFADARIHLRAQEHAVSTRPFL